MRTPTPWILPIQPIARADLLASGVTARMLRTRLGSRDLVQVRRGVYLRTDAWPTDAAGRHVVSARAEQTVHTAAVVSHQSAALILGMPTPGFGHWEDQPVSLTLPVTGNSTSSATVIHHTGPLPATSKDSGRFHVVTAPAPLLGYMAHHAELAHARTFQLLPDVLAGGVSRRRAPAVR